ncbi:acetyltransferase [Flavobacterium sp. 316]|nr:acetyltransferase [Flavobacterium sp. 316]
MVIKIEQTNANHSIFCETIIAEMENSAKVRGTGIAKRSVEYLNKKITEGNAIIAITEENEWAGFCYIETWSEEKFVVNSGLIVAPKYRIMGLARSIKKEIFKLSRQKYPEAKIFGLTTGLAVMKINSELGYEPITYSEITQDEKFWDGCKSCINYEILISKNKKNCLCTAMMYDKDDKLNQKRENEENSFSI